MNTTGSESIYMKLAELERERKLNDSLILLIRSLKRLVNTDNNTFDADLFYDTLDDMGDIIKSHRES